MSSAQSEQKVEPSQNAPPQVMPEPGPYAPNTNPQASNQGAPPAYSYPQGYPGSGPPTPPARPRGFRRPMPHPCAYGYHEPRVEFGLCGILAAIFCFPIGLLCLCLDTDRRCVRCGMLV